MHIWHHNIHAESRSCVEVQGDNIRIGRQGDNDLVLASPLIADQALVLQRTASDWEVLVTNPGGCQINRTPLKYGDRVRISGNCRIDLFPFTLELEPHANGNRGATQQRVDLEREASSWLEAIHTELLGLMDIQQTERARQVGADAMMRLERTIDELAERQGIEEEAHRVLMTYLAGCETKGGLLERVLQTSEEQVRTDNRVNWSALVSAVPLREAERNQWLEEAWNEFGLQQKIDLREKLNRIDTRFWRWWQSMLGRRFDESLVYMAKRHLKRMIKDSVFGFGPLEDLLRLPYVTEIMVVGRDRIFIEQGNRLEETGRRFVSDEVTLAIIERIVGQVGRRIDKSQPIVDARLPDGSRVHAAIPPVALDGPLLTIRRFPRRYRVSQLIRNGSLSESAAAFLRACVLNRRNILVTGGTGSGKTTLLNGLAEWLPEAERIITIEDTAELHLDHRHVVRMETKMANAEGSGALTIRDLVRTALRMRPDRLVIGECRGGEALDMLQAMNTGHDGSLTTLHANSPQDVPGRLEALVQMAIPLPVDTVHQQISTAIDLVVHVERTKAGRKVTSICEVTPIDPRTRRVTMRPLFTFQGSGDEAALQPTGHLPTFLGELIEKGLYHMHGFFRTAAAPRQELVRC